MIRLIKWGNLKDTFGFFSSIATNSDCKAKRMQGQWELMHCLNIVFLDIPTYNGHVHGVRVGVWEVAEQEQRVVLGQAPRVVQVPQLKADVLHRCSLHREKNTAEAVQRAALNPRPSGGCRVKPPGGDFSWWLIVLTDDWIRDPMCCTSLSLYCKTLNEDVVCWVLFNAGTAGFTVCWTSNVPDGYNWLTVLVGLMILILVKLNMLPIFT